MIDHVPERDRFALGDKINFTGDRRAGFEPVGGQKVGTGGVIDVDRIDQRVVTTYAPELPAPGSGDDPRKQVVVARAPDQVRAKRNRRQVGPIGLEDDLLGLSLGLGISCLESLGVRNRFVDALHVPAVEYNAGRAGVDYPQRAMRASSFDHVSRSLDVDLLILVFRAPDARLGRGVEHRVAPPDGVGDRLRVRNVSLDLLDFELVEVRVRPPGQASHCQPTLSRQLDQGRAQEPAAARDQHPAEIRSPHRSLLEAQTASFSRKILALWRMSTGNEW